MRDFEKQHFTDGIRNIAQSLKELNEVLSNQIPADCHIAVLGTSSGGYAAARFAEDVCANRLVMFSPPLIFKNVAAINKSTKMCLDNVRIFLGGRNKHDRKLASEWGNTDYASSIRWFNTTSHGTLKYLFKSGQIGALFEWLLGGAEIPSVRLRSSTSEKLFIATSWFKRALIERMI